MTASLVLLIALALPGSPERDRFDVEIPMRDGPALAADIFLPPEPGRYPTILIQTPYDKRHLRAPILGKTARRTAAGRGAISDLRAFLDRDRYAYVVADWRGFYGSRAAMAGVNRRRWRRGLDGYDCVEWIAKQDWSDGKVGTWGGSALGKQQFDTAVEKPPHLVCAAPLIAAMGQGYDFYYEGGIYREAHVKLLDLLGYGVSRKVRLAPRPDSPLWALARRLTYHPEKIDVPCLLITGWWDNYPDRVMETFEDLCERGGDAARTHSRLLIGPWDHVSVGVSEQGDREFPGAALESARAVRTFFDHFLLGRDNGWDKTPRVRYWPVNGDRWDSAKRWSAIERSTTELRLGADGSLGGDLVGGSRSYVHDPKSPAPTLGGANLPPLPHGPTVHDRLDAREDILVYATGGRRAPLRINGNMRLTFEFVADRPCLDFTARLCEVREGRSYLLAEAAQRVWNVAPGERTTVTLTFPALAAEAKDLKLYLASSNWPRHERNTHTGADHWDAKEAVPLNVTVRHESAVLRIPCAR